MGHQYNLQKIANYINKEQKIDLQVTEKANDNQSASFIIKLLSLFGGIVANIAFIGFLFLFNAFDSSISTLIIALLLIGSSLFFSKIKGVYFLETLMTSTYLSGICCLIASLIIWKVEENVISSIVAIVCLLSFYFIDDYIIRLIAVVTFFQSILFTAVNIESYIPAHLILVGCILAVALILKHEAYWYANKILNTYYQPLLTGLQITAVYLSVFSYPIYNSIYFISFHIVLCSILFWIIYDIAKKYNNSFSKKWIVFIVPLLGIAFISYFEVKILFSLLFILIAFRYREVLFFGCSILYFIIAIGIFYYDISISLLYKSILLMVSGILFIGLFMLLKSITNHEKNN